MTLMADAAWLRDKTLIERSAFFSAGYYSNVASLDETISPIEHFCNLGWKVGLSPSPFFDTSFYLLSNIDVVEAGLNPLLHFLLYGEKEGRSPHPRFDPVRFAELHRGFTHDPMVSSNIIDAVTDIATHDRILTEPESWSEADLEMLYNIFLGRGVDITGKQNALTKPRAEVVRGILISDEFFNEIVSPVQEGVMPCCPLFCLQPNFEMLAWIKQNLCGGSFVTDQGQTADLSWLLLWKSLFENEKFIENYCIEILVASLRQSIVNLVAKSERLIKLKTDTINSGFWEELWYVNSYPEVEHQTDALEHYLNIGGHELKSPGPRFDAHWYFHKYLLADDSFARPLDHFLSIGRDLDYATAPNSVLDDWLDKYNQLSSFEANEITRLKGSINSVILNINSLPSCLSSIRESLLNFTAGTHFVFIDIENVVLNENALGIFLGNHLVSMSVVAYSDFLMSSVTGSGNLSDTIITLPHYSALYFSQLRNVIGCFSFFSSQQEDYFYLANVIQCLINEEITQVELTGFFNALSSQFPPMLIPRPVYRFCGVISSRKLVPVFDESPGTVTIIIPTKNNSHLLRDCISSILRLTNYNFRLLDLLIVDNGSTEVEALAYLQEIEALDCITVVRDMRKFNYARINNDAASIAKGDYLLFLNNDTVLIDPEWINKLFFHARRPNVGCVGCKLIYPDCIVQHGGVIGGLGGVAGHANHNINPNEEGLLFSNILSKEVLAVTGACLMIKKERFYLLAGFDESFEVAFNDIALCMSAIKKGWANILVNDPLLIHLESKSRGYDDTPAKVEKWRRESDLFLSRYFGPEDLDPYYSSNRSLYKYGALSFPPRSKYFPNALYEKSQLSLRVMMVSITFAVGHGVAVVIDQQTKYLRSCGMRVFLAGPKNPCEIPSANSDRLYLYGPAEAADVAVRFDIDVLICHTPPFFSCTRFLGRYPVVITYDYGEPPAEWFVDTLARIEINHEKRQSFHYTQYRAAISQSVVTESGVEGVTIFPLANSHLGRWTSALIPARISYRSLKDWSDKIIVLNVCRFHAAEQSYKGIDVYLSTMRSLMFLYGAKVEFILCGKGTDDEAEILRAAGLTVVSNVSDVELLNIYAACDIYMNFSRWEGYNLGIAQALAFGLPVIASDIPAHRAFGVYTPRDKAELIKCFNDLISQGLSERDRTPLVVEWSDSMKIVRDYIMKAAGRIGSEAQ